jgi:signal transduction histidine kinase
MNYQLFWKTSLYRALIAKDFVQAEQPADGLVPEEAFMAGLIAEIGLLLLFSQCPNTKKKDFPGNGVSLEETIAWEEKNFGINHRELGSIVLKHWRFPENLVGSQKCFGANALKTHAPALCKTVELARRATDVVFGETSALHDFQALVQETIGLDPGMVNSILARAFGKVEELAQQLQVEVDSQKDILAVMEKANQALVRINSSMETALSGLLDNVEHVDLPSNGSSEQRKHGRDILQNTLDAVAHEIRNPLLAIGGFSRRLSREAQGKGRGSEYAKIIAEEAARLEGILQDVTEYCQGYRPGMVNEDLVHLVTLVLEEADSQLKQRKIQIARDFPNEPVLVSAERKGMMQALRLLLDNAINGLDKTGKGLINVTICPEHRGMSVHITDNGCPMPDEIRDVLVDGNLSAKTFGGGLRLAMARKVVEAHRGQISLAVKEGQGNRVALWLPTTP